MTEIAYYLSFVLNAFLAAGACFVVRASIKSDRLTEDRAKSRYSVAVMVRGIFSGIILFGALVGLFHLLGLPTSYGHGEVIVAAFVFNLFLSLLLLILGRILLGWQPFPW